MYILFDCVALLGLLVVPVSFIVWLILKTRKKPSAKRWKWITGISLIVTVLCFAVGLSITPEPTTSPDSERIEETVEGDTTEPIKEPTSEPTEESTEQSPEQENIPSETPVVEPAGDSVDTSITFADIYKEFKRNELNAKDLYNGNRYEITGKVNGMSTGGLFNMTGGATLTMEIKVDNTVVFFTAEFEKEQEDNLKQISVGETITFIGTCYGGNFTDCELR